MKIQSFILILVFAFTACNNGDEEGTGNETAFKEKMRKFVIGISQYAKSSKNGFLIVPQNGIELVSENGEATGNPHIEYLKAIDANGQEDLFYGYENDDKLTPKADNEYLVELLNISKNANKTILVTDYCSTPSKVTLSYNENSNRGFVSFAADHRELDNIPVLPDPINQENSAVITDISQVKNFLYLINPANFNIKTDFINAVISTNYDLLIMDLFFNDGSMFSASEIDQLKEKANGGKRLVICYMSIGEAEDYRYYWKSDWNTNKPAWLDKVNPDWAGNFKVKYWEPDWQSIIYGNDESYLKKILDAKFDGVYLDIIDAFEYYE